MNDFPNELQTLLEISKTPCIDIHFTIKHCELIPDTNSKVGGLGYLPMGEAYPLDKSGKPLVMLAQINFAQVANSVNMDNLPLPSAGILQFYIADDEDCLWGLDDNELPVNIQGKDFQVRFWQDISAEFNIDELNKAKAFLESHMNDDEFYMPFAINREYLMNFTWQMQACTPFCYELEDFANKAQLKKDFLDYDDKFIKHYCKIGNVAEDKHQLLGYPDFCQDDPRFYPKDNIFKEYILLFQLSSEYVPDNWEIIWGDAGVANFFIHPDDLRNADFSKILYNWDCC